MSSAEGEHHPRVVNVAAGAETTASPAPVRDARHEALDAFIGKWINEGCTVATSEAPSIPILTSDVYEWAPGGFFVIHTAYGKIGETSVGGVEVIGVDGDAYRSTFYDSFGNVHTSRVEIEGDVIKWFGDRTRCVATMEDEGSTQTAHHEVMIGDDKWVPSMDVTLRKVS
ncbi:MAG: hypothetical protein WA614_03910 [Acidimicrobiales bacterium]|jgi:hypothetical protein